MAAVAADAQFLAEAQRKLDARRAQQGIAPRRRPGDVILDEVMEGVERLRRSQPAPSCEATVRGTEERDAEDPLGDPLPEGDYSLSFARLEVGRVYDRIFWVAHLRVTEGPCAERTVPRFYNPPRTGRRLARSSNLWRDFVALTGRRPPSDGFGPAWLLKGCVVRGHVVTVTTRSENGRRIQLAECERYSRVDALLAIEAGAPPALTGSQEGRKAQRKK